MLKKRFRSSLWKCVVFMNNQIPFAVLPTIANKVGVVIPKAVTSVRIQLSVIFKNGMPKIILHRKTLIDSFQAICVKTIDLSQASFNGIVNRIYLNRGIVFVVHQGINFLSRSTFYPITSRIFPRIASSQQVETVIGGKGETNLHLLKL